MNINPPKRILIVEDEQILAENLQSFFSRHSSDVRTAFDAEDAMEVLKSFTPDLIVLDYALPGVDGLSAYSEIVRTSSHQPACVMITGFATDLLVENAQLQGINHVLSKPFSFAELQTAVDQTTVEHQLSYVAANRRIRAEERRTRQVRYPTNRRRQFLRRQILSNPTT